MYHKKIYGDGFCIMGNHNGWDIGIWTESIPETTVMLKPINKEDFVFACLDNFSKDGSDTTENSFCGIIMLSWMACLHGEYRECSEEEAHTLLETKLNRYGTIPEVKVNDYIYVTFPFDETEKVKITEIKYLKDGIYLFYNSKYIGDSFEMMDSYGKTWNITGSSSNSE